jgi:hypothetical protein
MDPRHTISWHVTGARLMHGSAVEQRRICIFSASEYRRLRFRPFPCRGPVASLPVDRLSPGSARVKFGFHLTVRSS